MSKNIDWTLQVKEKTHQDSLLPKPVHAYTRSQNIMEQVPHTPSTQHCISCQRARVEDRK